MVPWPQPNQTSNCPSFSHLVQKKQQQKKKQKKSQLHFVTKVPFYTTYGSFRAQEVYQIFLSGMRKRPPPWRDVHLLGQGLRQRFLVSNWQYPPRCRLSFQRCQSLKLKPKAAKWKIEVSLGTGGLVRVATWTSIITKHISLARLPPLTVKFGQTAELLKEKEEEEKEEEKRF